MDQKLIKIRKKLKSALDEARYEHTLGVMYTAASMAMYHGENIDDALLAGLLHDCAKAVPNEKKISLCKKYKLPINESERANPGLLHAKLGAEFAKRKYGVTDQNILNAITNHTTGRPGMSTLEKIIYIADYIEPGRKVLPNFPIVRKLAFQDLDKCMFVILKDSLVYLQSRDLSIDPMTEQTYLFYKEKLGK